MIRRDADVLDLVCFEQDLRPLLVVGTAVVHQGFANAVSALDVFVKEFCDSALLIFADGSAFNPPGNIFSCKHEIPSLVRRRHVYYINCPFGTNNRCLRRVKGLFLSVFRSKLASFAHLHESCNLGVHS